MIIKSKILLYNPSLKEITGKEHTMEAEICIHLSEIIAIREHANEDDGEINPHTCAVYTRGGENFCLLKSYASMKQHWLEYTNNLPFKK